MTVIVWPAHMAPDVLRKELSAPWVWMVVEGGWIRAAGSEVCSSVAFEVADAARRRLAKGGRSQ